MGSVGKICSLSAVLLVAILTIDARPSRTGGHVSYSVPDDLEYYGGAKGTHLTYDPVLGWTPIKERPKEETEDVGQESETPPASGPSDTIIVSQPPAGVSVAEARPIGIAIAGVGGVAASKPIGTAVVGPGGLAVSRPVATAIAGVNLPEGALQGIGGEQASALAAETIGYRDPIVRGYLYGQYRPEDQPHPPVIQERPLALLQADRGYLYGYQPAGSGILQQPLVLQHEDRGHIYGYQPPTPDQQLQQALQLKPQIVLQQPLVVEHGDRGPQYGYQPPTLIKNVPVSSYHFSSGGQPPYSHVVVHRQ